MQRLASNEAATKAVFRFRDFHPFPVRSRTNKMAETVESRMNLAALQRLDPYIDSILATASQVALYQFNAKTSEWEKTEIEGTLFVYSRCAKPWHGLIIMNRLNRENLIEPLHKAMEFQQQDPFLLYRNAKMVIYGIWFYNQDDCPKIHATMNRLTTSFNERNDSVQKKQLNKNPLVTENSDILTMLVQAQNTYNKVAVSEGGTKNSEPKLMTENAINASDLVRPRAVRPVSSVGPPPDVTNGTSVPASTSLSVAALFANAEKMQQIPQKSLDQAKEQGLSIGVTANGNSEKTPASTVENVREQNLIPVLQRLFSHTEQSAEPGVRQTADSKPQPAACRTESSENLLKKLQLIQVDDHRISERGKTDDSKMGISIDDEHHIDDREKLISPLLPSFVSLPPPPFPTFDPIIHLSPPPLPLLPQPTIMGNITPFQPVTPNDLPQASSLLSSNIGYLSTTPPRSSLGDIPLMSPMMFTSPKVQTNIVLGKESQPKVSSGIELNNSITPHPTALNKDQLLQALEYLLKNDPEFIERIHTAYTESLTSQHH